MATTKKRIKEKEQKRKNREKLEKNVLPNWVCHTKSKEFKAWVQRCDDIIIKVK